MLINTYGVPITAEASKIHGIHDSDLQDCPKFKELAQELHTFLSGCDVCGYSFRQLDVPMLRFAFRSTECVVGVLVSVYLIFNLASVSHKLVLRPHDSAEHIPMCSPQTCQNSHSV